MTAGSIIVFSNGDRKMAANEEAIFSLLGCVYRAMTEEMTPASNVEEELLRVFPFFFFLFFFPCCCTAASFVQSTSIRSTKTSLSIKHGLRTTDYGLRTGYKTRTQV